MRYHFILAVAFTVGASILHADEPSQGHQRHAGHGPGGCKGAEKFLNKYKSQLEALFDAEAEGNLKTWQDFGKMKLNLLTKLVELDTPYCPACTKVARKLNKIAIKVAKMRALEKNANASDDKSDDKDKDKNDKDK